MADVVFGYVYDFGSGEEWTAERGEGAFLNGDRLGAVKPKDEIEILSFEATTTAQVADKAAQWSGARTACGSWARSRSRSATSPRDGSTPSARSSPRARSTSPPAQLLVRECGLAIDLFEDPPFERAPLDLIGRSRVVAAGTTELCSTLADALTA